LIRGLALVALVTVGSGGARAKPEEPDLETLVVPEPAALVARTPSADIRRLLRPEASILAARDRLDQDLHRREEELTSLTRLEQRLDLDLAATTTRFEARTAGLEHDRNLTRTRLALLGRSLSAPALGDLLTDATGFLTFEARRSARALLAEADRARIRRYAETLDAWRKAKADLERRTTNLARTRETMKRLRQQIAWDQEEQAAVKTAVVNEPEFYAAFAAEMEKLDETLAAKVKELSAAAPTDRKRMYFEETRGGLAVPILNPDLVGGYGTRNYKGIRSMWRGIHLVPARTPKDGKVPVRAIYWGWVAWTGWIQGLGRVVILDHTMGYTSIYAHLAEISVEVGAKVKTGETLGIMGESESFFGPRLYHELRKDGVAMDPMSWFR
jgi:septal ring factor EnvC (AmiA/AmiB activator)